MDSTSFLQVDDDTALNPAETQEMATRKQLRAVISHYKKAWLKRLVSFAGQQI
jgi:hypothetical protein